DGFLKIGVAEVCQGLEQRGPTVFPGSDQVGLGILLGDDELRITVSVGIFTIGSEKVSPTRGEIARHMFDNGRDTIGKVTRFTEKVTVCLYLAESLLRPFLLLAEAEGDLFETKSGHAHDTLLSGYAVGEQRGARKKHEPPSTMPHGCSAEPARLP